MRREALYQRLLMLLANVDWCAVAVAVNPRNWRARNRMASLQVEIDQIRNDLAKGKRALHRA